MKRPTDMSEEDWQEMLATRKRLAVDRMTIADLKRGFVTEPQIFSAAKFWGCSQHAAEMRLTRGEIPDEWGTIDDQGENA